MRPHACSRTGPASDAILCVCLTPCVIPAGCGPGPGYCTAGRAPGLWPGAPAVRSARLRSTANDTGRRHARPAPATQHEVSHSPKLPRLVPPPCTASPSRPRGPTPRASTHLRAPHAAAPPQPKPRFPPLTASTCSPTTALVELRPTRALHCVPYCGGPGPAQPGPIRLAGRRSIVEPAACRFVPPQAACLGERSPRAPLCTSWRPCSAALIAAAPPASPPAPRGGPPAAKPPTRLE